MYLIIKIKIPGNCDKYILKQNKTRNIFFKIKKFTKIRFKVANLPPEFVTAERRHVTFIPSPFIEFASILQKMASFKIKIYSCYGRISSKILAVLLLWTLAVRGGEYKDGDKVRNKFLKLLFVFL